MARPGGRRKVASTRLLFHITIQRAGRGRQALRGRSYGKSVRFSSRSRPLPAFFLFMDQHRKDLQDTYPRWSAVQLAKRLGRMWHKLPRRERAMYKAQAMRLKSRRGRRRRGRAVRRGVSARRQGKNVLITFTTRAETLRRFLMAYA